MAFAHSPTPYVPIIAVFVKISKLRSGKAIVEANPDSPEKYLDV